MKKIARMATEIFFTAVLIGIIINIPLGHNAFIILSIAQKNWLSAGRLVGACIVADILWAYLAVSPEVQVFVKRNIHLIFKYVGVFLIIIGGILYFVHENKLQDLTFGKMLWSTIPNVSILFTAGSLVFSLIPEGYLVDVVHRVITVLGIAFGGVIMWMVSIWSTYQWGKNYSLVKIKKKYAIVVIIIGVSWFFKVATET